jgi:[acyl-carrier-protein] S-malonyltransferase
VRWIDEEVNIAADGFELCLETGPGTVLTGLWKASGSSISCIAAGTLDALVSFSL